MSYIQQSLIRGEKVIHIGRFHWIYFVGALFWIAVGIFGCMFVLSLGMGLNVHTGMKALYPNQPSWAIFTGWSHVIDAQGGYIAAIRDINGGIRLAAFAVLLIGMGLFGHMMVVRATTEIAVTTSRLVLKEGIVARNVDEMNINRIESVHVIQSVLGRILNYGTVMVRGMGVGEIVLPPLARPVTMRNAIEKARELHAQHMHAAIAEGSN